MLEIVSYQEFVKGHTVAKLDVKFELPKIGFVFIRGICLKEKDGKRWVSLPSFSHEGPNGQDWKQYFEYENKTVAKKFCEAIMIELKKREPSNKTAP